MSLRQPLCVLTWSGGCVALAALWHVRACEAFWPCCSTKHFFFFRGSGQQSVEPLCFLELTGLFFWKKKTKQNVSLATRGPPGLPPVYFPNTRFFFLLCINSELVQRPRCLLHSSCWNTTVGMFANPAPPSELCSQVRLPLSCSAGFILCSTRAAVSLFDFEFTRERFQNSIAEGEENRNYTLTWAESALPAGTTCCGMLGIFFFLSFQEQIYWLHSFSSDFARCLYTCRSPSWPLTLVPLFYTPGQKYSKHFSPHVLQHLDIVPSLSFHQ